MRALSWPHQKEKCHRQKMGGSSVVGPGRDRVWPLAKWNPTACMLMLLLPQYAVVKLVRPLVSQSPAEGTKAGWLTVSIPHSHT